TAQAYPTSASVSRRAVFGRAAVGIGFAGVAAGLFALGPRVASAAVAHVWPPFALVTGLVLIGQVAADDGIFEWAGSLLATVRCGATVLLTAELGLVAL